MLFDPYKLRVTAFVNGQQPAHPVGPFKIKLLAQVPNEDGTNIVAITGGGYLDQTITAAQLGTPNAAGDSASTVVVTFPKATADQGTVRAFMLTEADDTPISFFPITPQAVPTGVELTIPIGGIATDTD